MTIVCPKCHAENPDSKPYCGDCGTRLTATPQPAATPPVSPGLTETIRTPIRELSRGLTFAGRYDIIEELGKGGMGKVYRVFDRKLEEEVALKLIRPEIGLDREVVDRFRNELRVSRRISHRNISRMFDLGEDEGTFFITMEYVPGEDLKSFLHRSKRLSIGTAVGIAEQVCDGLAEAHRQGIVHRDLKPANIMVDKDGNVRIMDFGIARSLTGKGLTAAGVMVGTPEYMSPEQVEGEDVDPRSDIYSLGIILYEMTTGRVPFGGETPISVGIKHKTERPAPPRDINPEVPEDLNRVILRCLEKSRAKRFASAAELRAALGQVEKGLPTTEQALPARKPLTSRVLTLSFPLKKVLWPAAGVAALALAALFFFKVIPRRRAAAPPPGKPTLAVLYFENISGDKALDAWRTGLTELLIAKLGQSRLVRVLDSNTIYGLLRRLNLAEAGKYTKDDLLRIANEAGAKYTLSGSLLRAGPDIVMTFSLQKPAADEVISPISVECRGEEEIIPRIDEVAAKVKSDLDLPKEGIASDPDKKAETITTASAEAFKCYSEGRRYHDAGDNQRCVEWMLKAVALDPEFAMAYRSLGSAYGNLGLTRERQRYYAKAFEFKGRVSDRERLSIEGDYYRQSETTTGQAIQAYKELLELYPDDVIGNTNLGVLYSDLEEQDLAIESFKVLADAGSDSAIITGNLAEAYEAKNQYSSAEEVLKKYLARFPDNASVHGKLAQCYALQGRYALALSEAERAGGLNPQDFDNGWIKANVYFLMDDTPLAEREARELPKFNIPQAKFAACDIMVKVCAWRGKFAQGREMVQTMLALARKADDDSSVAVILSMLASFDEVVDRNYDRALERLDEALGLAVKSGDPARQRSLLQRKGILELEKNSMPEAEKVAAELRARCDRAPNRRQMRLYYELLGRIDLAKKDPRKALEHFGQMTALWTAADPSSLIADSLDLAGDKARAFDEYQKINASPKVKLNDVSLYLQSFFRLGQLAAAMGQKDKAAGFYGKLVEMWKDADPGAPIVESVRKALAEIKGR